MYRVEPAFARQGCGTPRRQRARDNCASSHLVSASLFAQLPVPVVLMRGPRRVCRSIEGGTAPATCFRGYTHPSCCIVTPSFQIFVIWRILSPSKAMS